MLLAWLQSQVGLAMYVNLNTMQSVLFSVTDPPPASANDSARREWPYRLIDAFEKKLIEDMLRQTEGQAV